MDSQQTFEFLRKGLHVTLGATTSLVESVQDPLKREENLAQLNLGFDELTNIWQEKGSVTENEARQFVDTVISSSMNAVTPNNNTYGSPTQSPSSGTTFNADIASEIEDLTTQISEIRNELSKPQNISLD